MRRYIRYAHAPQTDLRQYVDKRVLVYHKGVYFAATVLDARVRFVKIDVLLTPVEGGGSFWMAKGRLRGMNA